MRGSVPREPIVEVLATIRAAREGDIEAVVAIENASFSDPWSAGDFSGVMSLSQAIFLVVEKEGEVAGYVIAMSVADEAEVLNIAVTPAQRGSRLGHSLLQAVILFLTEKNVASVFLEVRESNSAARSLYRRFGFEEISRRKKYYRNPVEDALILRLEIKR
jgi:ribosomal-protein-alanine N-acetyltransferase